MGNSQKDRFGVSPSRLQEIEESVNASGRWQHYVEQTHGAGSTLQVESDPPDYRVIVEWGSQKGEVRVRTLESAVEVAYRLAYDFYEIRRDSDGAIL
jgi:hypothetical protein